MSEGLYPPADFEASIRILTREQGGRRTQVFNGIRWDFAYADDGYPPPTLYMIWPDFFDVDDRSLSTDQPLPVGIELPARMSVLVDEMRVEVHRNRIVPGVRFFCHEGKQRVAEGVVTSVTGIHAAREREKDSQAPPFKPKEPRTESAAEPDERGPRQYGPRTE